MNMIMDTVCPHCGSKAITFGSPDYEWDADKECICTWDAKCENEHEFIISEILTVTSRLVARDSDHLDELIELEEKE